MYLMVIDDRLLRQIHQERVQATALERLAMAAHRDARAPRQSAARPDWQDLLAGPFHGTRAVSRSRGVPN